MDGNLRGLERAEAARERLLRAALGTFSQVGFEAASTRVIAARAGTRQGLVRHHFGSKAGLFLEVLDRAARQLERDLEAAGPLSVEGLLVLLARHADLARLIAHALLASGAPGEAVRERFAPLGQHVLELHRAAQGDVPDAELRAHMWLASAFVAAAAHDAASMARPRAAGDVLFAWLCAGPPRASSGPFSTSDARARLRG
jgi:AcrR family transcriptional regulator